MRTRCRATPEVDEAARLLVPVELPGRAVRANVTIEEALLARIDAAAAARGMTRSAFLARALGATSPEADALKRLPPPRRATPPPRAKWS
jgi:hypothetical protein